MKRAWIVGGWSFALIASALPVLWVLSQRIERDSLGLYVDPATGTWLPNLYWQFVRWWLPIALPVSALAVACMALNRPR